MIKINGTSGITNVDGTAASPALTGADTDTGVFTGTDIVGISTGGTERVRVDASGNVSIGATAVQGATKFEVFGNTAAGHVGIRANNSATDGFGTIWVSSANSNDGIIRGGSTASVFANQLAMITSGTTPISFYTDNTERARIGSNGILLVGKTSSDIADTGFQVNSTTGETNVTVSSSECMNINRNTNDGDLVRFRQDNNVEGSISVSGTTVSYNGGHLSRWAQTTTPKDDSLVKGTVLSNLDEMNVYVDADGNPVENEQLNKVTVSDVEGDANVAGVFVNWSYDEAHDVDEINIAMTGDMIIRIAEGVTVQRGDLLMSAGDGTAKPQGDDIVRSKTIAKVTSTHVTCTYADGSFCVPCVLMAC